ncbi:MAG: LacI family transcriptional regulator [Fimbriimonadales bacterium]|nr:MAG: LacI family transcriptional regulator [Fimbriimonadales bacterium]
MADLKQIEIARLAGVSQATVSRVLKGDPQVNEAMRERVLAVVQELGYVPDSRAQSLRSQRTRLLGLVIHRAPEALASDPFFSALIASIVEQAGKHEYHLCVDTARTARSQRAIYEELLRTRRVDGLILVESESHDKRIERLSCEGFPFVLIGRYEPEDAIATVDNDNIGAAYMATDYLIRTGRTRVAYIGGPAGLTVTRDRLQGYKSALEAHGLAYDARLVAFADFNLRSASSAMTDLLGCSAPPDAVLAMDDLIALSAMREAKRQGRRIPDDIAFIGFNDSPLCQYVEPSLTSIAVEIPALARRATEMLVKLIEGHEPTPKRQIVPARLVKRESA